MKTTKKTKATIATEKQISVIAAHMRAKKIAEQLFGAVADHAVIAVYDRMPEEEEDEGEFLDELRVSQACADVLGVAVTDARIVLDVFDRLDDFEGDDFPLALRNAASATCEIFGGAPAPEVVLSVFDALNGSEDDDDE